MRRDKDQILREYDDQRIDAKDKIKRRIELEVQIDIRDALDAIQEELFQLRMQHLNTM